MTVASESFDSLPSGSSRRSQWLLRHSWWTLIPWALLWAAVHFWSHGWSWHFFVTGVHALFSPAGLSVYVHHPELQMGPLAFVAAAPFVLFFPGQAGQLTGILAITALGLVAVREIALIAYGAVSRITMQWFASSLLILIVWAEVAAQTEHFDDALAIVSALIGLRLVRQSHPLAAAIMFGLAVDFKPWALPFGLLLLLAARRSWLPAAGLFVVVVAAAWLPFIVADPRTLEALHFGIRVDRDSTLHLIQPTATVTPGWDRYAQAGAAIVLSLIAIWRRQWAAVFTIVFAVRLLLDPGTKNYYDAGLVVGTALFDLITAVGALPFATMAAMLLVYLPSHVLVGLANVRGIIRTIALVGLLAAVVVVPALTRRAPVAAPRRPSSPAQGERSHP